MSTIGRDMTRPALALGGLGYLTLLGVAMLWWHMTPEMVMALTVGAVCLLIIGLRPLIGIQAFVFVMYVAEVLTTDTGITGMKVVGGVILAGWLVSAALQRRLNVPMTSLTVAILLFLAWGGVSVVYAIDPEAAIVRMLTYVQLFVSALMFASVVDEPARMLNVFKAVIFWTVLSTVVALGEYYAGITKVAAGLIGNRNALAIYIDGGIICAYLLYQLERDFLRRTLLLVTLLVLFFGLGLTFSRTGLIVMFICLTAVWYRVARDKGVSLVVVSTLLMLFIALILPQKFYERVASIAPAVERQEDTYGTRVQLWKVGMRMIEDRPVVGVGPANFMQAYRHYARGAELARNLVAHNTFVGLASEHGLVGLCLFLVMIYLSIKDLRFVHRVARARGWRDLGVYAVMIEANIIMVLLIGLSGNNEYLKYLWMFLGLGMGLGQMARRQLASSSAQVVGFAPARASE